MDDQQHDLSYPDPASGYHITPYPEISHQTDPYSYAYAQPEEGYYPPMPQPLMHEGFMPRGPQPLMHEGFMHGHDMDADSDVDEDPSAGYGALQAQYGLNFVLNPQSAHADFSHNNNHQFDNHNEIIYEDDFEREDPQLHRSRLDSAERELLDARDNPRIDPDFAMSDGGDDSSDASINSELLNAILDEEIAAGSRGRGKGRARARGNATGRKRGWKWAIKGTDHDPKMAKGRGRGRGRPRGNGVPRGEGRRKAGDKRNTVAEPDPEFKRLQSLATQAFLNNNYQAAADYARDAVKANPEIFAAHSLLSEILLAQGKDQDSLTVLLHGAHTRRDPALWWTVAERTLELAGDNRSPSVLEQAIYCFAWAIKLDPDDYDARREKLNLLLESDQPARARGEAKMMVRQKPHDLNIVRQYADLCAYSASLPEIRRAKDAYDVAINFYFKGRSLGVPETQWSHLNVYLDLVEKCENPAQAAFHLKKLSRWLLGRKEDTFWDTITGDDREFDNDDVPRRIQIPEFKYSRFAGQKQMYGEGLPLELKVKLGLFRVKVSRADLPEAMRHFQQLLDLKDDVADYYDLFRDVAEGLLEQTYYAEAILFYEPIRSVPEACDHEYYMKLADCYMMFSRNSDAESCWKFIVDNDPEDIKSRIALAKLYESEQRMAEAVPLVHEVIRLGRSDAVKKAKITVDKPPPPRALAPLMPRPDQPASSGRHAGPVSRHYSLGPMPEDGEDGDYQDEEQEEEEDEEEDEDEEPIMLRPSKRGRKATKPKAPKARVSQTFERLQQQDQRIKANHVLVNSARETLDDDEDAVQTYFEAAQEMMDDFKTVRAFYPGRDKHIKFTGYGRNNKNPLIAEMEAMKKRIANDDMDMDDDVPDESIPDNFHDIKFTEWLDIFCEYALLLAKAADREKCYEILTNTHFATVFYHNLAHKSRIHATWMACALLLNDEQKVCEVGRFFITEWPHSGAAYQLFAAVNRLFAGYSNWFNSGPTQKFILRQVKALDYALLDPESRAAYAFTGQERSSYTHAGKRDANPYNLPDLDAGVLSLYGHIMAAAQSWTSALNYYFRVLTLDKGNVSINLCIATAYMQMAMKRQAENRHWQIYQGVAFLQRYVDLRKATGLAIHEQEAAYNVARSWHLLGIMHLAIPEYEKALALAEKVREEAREKARREDSDGEDDEQDGEVDAEEFTQEAAFALMHILAMNNNERGARKIAEKYLVL
ncbi:TPR-like protein [Aureobasidium subglaciale]|nr:TPR-like protein [Aureobasidium subglaciale]